MTFFTSHRARQALSELLIPGTLNSHVDDDPTKDPTTSVAAIELFDTLEVYPGSKISHLKEIHRKTGIPYSEMASRLQILRNGKR